MLRGVCDGLRLPCGAAQAHWPLLDSNRMGAHKAMCAAGVLVLLSILLLLFLLTPATEGVEMLVCLGVCVSFWLPRRVADITIDFVLQARAKMSENRVNRARRFHRERDDQTVATGANL